MKKAYDYIFGANWVEQFRENYRVSTRSETRAFPSIAMFCENWGDRSIDKALWWDETPQGHDIWSRRHRNLTRFVLERNETD